MGDIHGDYDKMINGLIAAKLIHSTTLNWSGGNAVLVQTGDLVDRGEQDKEVIDFFMKLQTEAAAAKGKVVVLRGNHEALVSRGDDHFVNAKSLPAWGGAEARRVALSKKGHQGKWLRTLPLCYHTRRTLFVHGFLGPDVLRLGGGTLPSLENDCFTLWDKFEEGKISENEIKRLRRYLDDDTCPIWRRPGDGDRAVELADLESTLRMVGADRMVVGHTPFDKDNFYIDHEGKLIVIDVGMSRWMMDGLPRLLEIEALPKPAAPIGPPTEKASSSSSGRQSPTARAASPTGRASSPRPTSPTPKSKGPATVEDAAEEVEVRLWEIVGEPVG